MASLRILWIFNIAIRIVFSQENDNDTPNITLLSTKFNNGYNLSCVISGENQQSAISWTPAPANHESFLISKFIPQMQSNFNCNFEDTNDCNEYWTSEWAITKSFDKYLDIVTDYRWEAFKIIYTVDSYEDDQIKYETVASIPNSNEFYIPISLRAPFESHVFLCDGIYPPKSNCYWIMLSAWRGEKSAIRKCKYEEIPQFSKKFANGDCAKLRDTNEHKHSNPLNETNWNHLIIKKRKETITVETFGENKVLLTFEDDPQDLFNVKHLIIYTFHTTGQWKIHNYKFIFTKTSQTSQLGPPIKLQPKENSICIAMFVLMCTHCYLELRLIDVTGSKRNSMIISHQGTAWKEIKFVTFFNNEDLYKSFNFYAYSYTDGNEDDSFWGIDDVRKCNETEYRELKIEVAERNQVSCEVLESSTKITVPRISRRTMIVNQSNQCENNRVGKNCIPCNLIYETKYCRNTLACYFNKNKESVCSCSPGFTGFDCEDVCTYGYYGLNCAEKCGNCLHVQCDPITGFCHKNKCKDNLLAPLCKESMGPILANAPVVVKVAPSSITLLLNDTRYQPQEYIITSYRIQFKKTYETDWRYYSTEFNLNEIRPIEITNLIVSTFYNFRAILFSSNKSYEGTAVPERTVQTSCRMITPADIEIKTTNQSAQLTFKDIEEGCHINDYKIVQTNFQFEVVSSTFEFRYLDPFRNYSITFVCVSCQKSFGIEFATTEGESTAVRNVKYSSKTSSSVVLSWDIPSYPYGFIKYYKVFYQHNRYLACKNRERDDQHRGNMEVATTNATINDLIPYSEYMIQIFAFNGLDGKVYEYWVATENEDMPEDSLVPTKITLNMEAEYSVQIVTSEMPNCATIKGDLFYNVVLQCLSEWCESDLITKNITWTNNNINNLLPYTNYSLVLHIGYRLGSINKQKTINGTFQTKSSEPGKVRNLQAYSKDDTSISLRFQPPYPPTGQLEKYYLHSSYYSIYWRNFETDIKISSCKIWKSYHCTTLQNLYGSYDYTISLQAKNIHSTYFGPKQVIYVKTEQSAPQAPENLKGQWDNYYNYTLTWNHPNVTNGPLTKFSIHIKPDRQETPITEIYKLVESDYSLEYKYQIRTKLKTSSNFCVDVKAHNINVGFLAELPNQCSPPKRPVLSQDFSVVSVTNTTIKLQISAPTDLEGKASFMYIFVTDVNNADSENNDNNNSKKIQKLRDKANITPNYFSWIAKEIQLTAYQDSKRDFVIGSDTKEPSSNLNETIFNRVLNTDTTYTISILLINKYCNLKRYTVYKREAKTEGNLFTPTNPPSLISTEPNHNLYFLLLLMILPVVFFLALWYKKKNVSMIPWSTVLQGNPTSRRPNPDIIPMNTSRNSQPQSPTRVSIKPKLQIQNTDNLLKKATPCIRTSKHSQIVKIIDFENYVKKSIENGKLEKQHKLFPRGLIKPADYGALPANKLKNRYNNLIAYDHSRVILEKIDDDQFSDYINASYINGYNTPKAYIATQGPKAATVNDFWRMVWQENVEYIIMVANTHESGKKKSEKYWPNIQEQEQYGNITVQFTCSQIFANYEFRTLSATCGNETRKVEQLHFVSWPDHGVPLYSQSLVPFLRKILTIPQGKSPIVVHCSAGVGRTGTIILCDICLRMAAREGMVDVLNYLHKLRQQRANMVDNIEQYKLAHLVLLECLVAPQTSLVCDESLQVEVAKVLEQGGIERQMQYLADSAWEDQAMRPAFTGTIEPNCENKNRFQEIIADGYGRIFLSRYPLSDDHSTYINAVYVDGFRMPEKFIATQQPLPGTVGDFWRMIHEKEVNVVVSLQEISSDDETTCEFWPTETLKEMNPVPYINLEYVKLIETELYQVFTVKMTCEKNKEVTVKTVEIISLKKWNPIQPLPRFHQAILLLWDETDRLSKGTGPIVVTCYDGATACGLFVALAFVVEKIKLEQQCDVCLAVRSVRHNRKYFVADADQFRFLYQAALKYLSEFETYSNFASNKK